MSLVEVSDWSMIEGALLNILELVLEIRPGTLRCISKAASCFDWSVLAVGTSAAKRSFSHRWSCLIRANKTELLRSN